jgi:hypothetical protein
LTCTKSLGRNASARSLPSGDSVSGVAASSGLIVDSPPVDVDAFLHARPGL